MPFKLIVIFCYNPFIEKCHMQWKQTCGFTMKVNMVKDFTYQKY